MYKQGVGKIIQLKIAKWKPWNVPTSAKESNRPYCFGVVVIRRNNL